MTPPPLAALALMLIISATTHAATNATTTASTEAAYDAFDRGDMQTAINVWRKLAGQGDTTAQFNLGQLYRLGNGVEPDDREALKWYLMAAQGGMVSAQYNLMMMYEEGRISQDDIAPLLATVNDGPNANANASTSTSTSAPPGANQASHATTNPNTALQQIPPEAYLVQVMASSNRVALEKFLASHRSAFKHTAQVLPISSKRSHRYVLLLGPFSNRDEAKNALNALPQAVRKAGPWVRTVASLQE
jgi:septal ring-binding cell division protein DamX